MKIWRISEKIWRISVKMWDLEIHCAKQLQNRDGQNYQPWEMNLALPKTVPDKKNNSQYNSYATNISLPASQYTCE